MCISTGSDTRAGDEENKKYFVWRSVEFLYVWSNETIADRYLFWLTPIRKRGLWKTLALTGAFLFLWSFFLRLGNEEVLDGDSQALEEIG